MLMQGPWLLRGIAVACLTYLVSVSDGLNFLDRLLTDARMQVGSTEATGKVVVIGIDAESLRQLDQWPWPRRYHAILIDRLLEAGALRIGIDIDFSSRSSPEDDALLAAALARASPSRVALPVFRQFQPTADGSVSIVETGPNRAFRPHVTETMANVIPDPDGLVRWLEPHSTGERGTLPTLAGWLTGVQVGPMSERRQLVDFGIDVATLPYYSYHDVVAGRLAPNALSQRVVLIGAVDVSLGDYVTVPHYRALPGVVFHALAAESLLQERLVRPLDGWWMDLVAAAAAFLFWWLLSALRPGWQISAALAVAAMFGLVTIAAQMSLGVAVSSAPLLAGLLFTALGKLIEHLHQLVRQRREAAAMAAQRHALFVQVVEANLDGIVVFDEFGAILSSNAVAGNYFGSRPEQLAGASLDSILPEDAARLLEALQAGETLEAERQFNLENGIRVATLMKLNSLDDSGFGKIGILTLHDVSARKTQTDALIHMASHDALTGLMNRTMFLKRLSETTELARRNSTDFAVLLIDLDLFKEVNDTLGHSIGESPIE
ncbi:MAG: CHASE2 domain-containing protein, partial [Pseudomonadota bacterium]